MIFRFSAHLDRFRRPPARRLAVAVLAPALLVIVISALIHSAGVRAQSSRPIDGSATSQSVTYLNCRLGAGGVLSAGYPITGLNLGWYMNWSAQTNPPRPTGLEFVQVVRLQPDLNDAGYRVAPPTSTLLLIAAQNPGATWLIGNEPDSPHQDKLPPELYARAYHEVYTVLKTADPAAQLGAGSVVQPTPLRFAYLDRVLAAYRQLYGQPLPADLWSIHSYILREIDSSDPQACDLNTQACNEPPYLPWGAYIPVGLVPTYTRGLLYTFSQMYDLNLFRQRLIDFRAWMRDRGYRDVPLYITEYGTLFPYPPLIDGDPYLDEFGAPLTEERTALFMTRTFDLLSSLIDSNLGLPADNQRLVQRWLWYSFDDTALGGPLFNRETGARRLLGDVFATYAQTMPPGGDLVAVRVTAAPAAVSDTGQLVSTTVQALVSNGGNIKLTGPLTVTFYAGTAPQGVLIGAPQVVTSGLSGCAATLSFTTTWPNLGTGAHPMYVTVETASDVDPNNNRASGLFIVARHHIFLPGISR